MGDLIMWNEGMRNNMMSFPFSQNQKGNFFQIDAPLYFMEFKPNEIVKIGSHKIDNVI